MEICALVPWWSHPCAPSISFMGMWRQNRGAQETVVWIVSWDLRMCKLPWSRYGKQTVNASCALDSQQILSSAFPSSILAYQQPNAKKLRRKAQRAEQLAAKGIVPRRQKQLLNRRLIDRAAKKSQTEANNNPERDFYDVWGQEGECCVYVCISRDDHIFALPVFP